MKIKYPYEFSPKLREKAKHYCRGRLLNAVFSGIFFPIAALLIILFSGAHLLLQSYSSSISSFFSVQIFAVLFLAIFSIAEFPLNFYISYAREHKYKLSNYTLSGWLVDYFKSLFLSFAISVVAITALYYLLANYAAWWIYAAILYCIFSLLSNYIFPVVIFPFFYRIKPYNGRAQKKRLLELTRKSGAAEIKNVVLAIESEKSKKANAMFAGLGNTKRIVLFDTLTKNFVPQEVETVVAHELGHYVNKDILRCFSLEAFIAFPAFFAIDIALRNFSANFGIASISSIATLPLILLSYSLIGILTAPVENWYSRRIESQADLFSLNSAKKPDAQISTDKRLADMNLSEINPSPLVEWYFYDHPAIEKRIAMSREWKERNKKKISKII